MQLNKIVVDELIYPRKSIDPFHVRRMVEAIETGAKFPPLVVESGMHRLVDGRHRYEALMERGVTTTKVIEKTYTNDADLYADAVRLNIAHGRALTYYDIRNIIIKLGEYGYELSVISDVVHIPPARIDEIQKGFASSPDGEPIALKGGLSHKHGATLTEQQMVINKRYGGAKAVFYAKQLIDLLENDLAPTTPGFEAAMNKLTQLWALANETKAA